MQLCTIMDSVVRYFKEPRPEILWGSCWSSITGLHRGWIFFLESGFILLYLGDIQAKIALVYVKTCMNNAGERSW